MTPYVYNAVIGHVHDGDTLTVDVDLGMSVWMHGVNVRLLGCNARELIQDGGIEARDNLVALLPAGTKVTVHTVKPDKFGGRYDAAVALADGSDLVTKLVADGWVAAWDGKGVKPVPPWPRVVGALAG